MMVLDEDVGKAGESEGDRKVKIQEGRPRDGWANSFFLEKDIFYIPDQHDQTQSDEQQDSRGVWLKAK